MIFPNLSFFTTTGALAIDSDCVRKTLSPDLLIINISKVHWSRKKK